MNNQTAGIKDIVKSIGINKQQVQGHCEGDRNNQTAGIKDIVKVIGIIKQQVSRTL